MPVMACSGRVAALPGLSRRGLVGLGEASMEVISPGPAGPIPALGIGSGGSAAPTDPLYGDFRLIPLASAFCAASLGKDLAKPAFPPGSIAYCLISYSGEAIAAS